MQQEKHFPIDVIVRPFQRFLQHEKSGGLVLGLSVIVAMILANSPWSEAYFHFFEQKLGFIYNGNEFFNFSLHHWINDGLMCFFFFVVGLELKREFVAGELAEPKKAILPIAAAIGGMIVPAIIYLSLNSQGEASNGWGIPMATDIAFALGILYLLGDRVPLALKVFLTALAIVDDLGAVIVIAVFYTEQISMHFLFLGLLFALFMYLGNRLGVRSVLFYAILGIGGVWTCFLMSGVHATIAAVLAAFMIPAHVRLRELPYVDHMKALLNKFQHLDPNDKKALLTSSQLHVLDKIQEKTDNAIPPLQKLEHAMNPFVTFVVIPLFALSNAGVSLNLDWNSVFETNVAIGVALGLFFGKYIGIVGFSLLSVKMKIAQLPKEMNFKSLSGLGFIGAVGFTMSLFVSHLAFKDPNHIVQAKLGIFAASICGGVVGYLILSRNKQRTEVKENNGNT